MFAMVVCSPTLLNKQPHRTSLLRGVESKAKWVIWTATHSTVAETLFPQLEGEYCSSPAELLPPWVCEYRGSSEAQWLSHFTLTPRVTGSNPGESNTTHGGSLCSKKLVCHDRNISYKRQFFIFGGFLFYFKFFLPKTEKPIANITHLIAQQCHIWHYKNRVGVGEHLVSVLARLCGWCKNDAWSTRSYIKCIILQQIF